MAKRKGAAALTEEEKKKLNRDTISKLFGILGFAKPYLGWFIFGTICLILSSVMLLGFPYLAGKLLDLAVGKPVPYFTSLNHLALVLIGVLLVQGIFSFIRVYTFSIVTERSLASIRKAVYQKLLWLPSSFFDSRRTGELLSRITTDVSTLSEMFSLTIAELLRQLIILILGAGVILYLTPHLTVFMLLTIPVLVIVAMVFGKYIRKLSRDTQDKLADANVAVEESLQSISVVKSFANEFFELNRYTKSIESVVKVAVRASRFRGLFISFIIFALFGGIVAVGWYGATLVQAGEITTGSLFAFVLYTSFIGGSIAGLGDIYTQIQRSIGASERILEILQEEDERDPATEEVALKLNGNIQFNHVQFSYPSRPGYTVLKDLNFSIQSGEKIALIGQSGSGKSTIVNVLLRLYDIESGSITVDGVDIKSYPLTPFRKNFGVVPQEVLLFGGSIRENIAYGKPDATFEEIYAAAEKANALEFIERFDTGFDTLVGDRGVKLSGGQRQRIAIARAILKDPAILILDEATSSLDAQAEVLVQEALEKLMAGRTSIIIAHRLSTIKKVDRIFVIKDGVLAETGSHNELTQLDNGIYSNLLKLQLQ
jgi:ATP-binding cassette subfamily B protein